MAARQQATVHTIRKQKKIARKQQEETEELLTETQEALQNNELHVARSAFIKIPPAASTHSEVQAVQNNLELAVDRQVTALLARGDAQYRADEVNAALKTWNEALALDPENPDLKGRIERANKVLARLEELKNRQRQ